MPLVEINGLKKRFHDKEVIKGLEMILEKGKCTALIGPNGAGKTTTLRMLSGLIKPSSGSIIFNDAKKVEDHRQLIGYLPQFPIFYDWMTGLEFLVYVGKLAGLSKKEANKRALNLFQLVGIQDAAMKRIGKYSGGMKQRLGIAQALIHQPPLLILDEPVSALDPLGRREVLELLQQLKMESTILFSTHILNDAEEICDKVLFLHEGKIVESGTMNELREKYQQSRIHLNFQTISEDIVRVIENLSSIESVTIEGNQIILFVRDIHEARKEILQESLQQNWPFLKFEVSRMTLEDVFMKVVRK